MVTFSQGWIGDYNFLCTCFIRTHIVPGFMGFGVFVRVSNCGCSGFRLECRGSLRSGFTVVVLWILLAWA